MPCTKIGAKRHTTAHYWRQAGNPPYEVDLVLDGFGGVSVGVEVKAASSVHYRDLAGLRALKSARGLDRGFLVYTGSEVQQLYDAVWALPVTALRSSAWAHTAPAKH
ncbi:MAG: DUF4143 domain-containing protein [Bifidobacteriaceae bacterium]|jgi:hypothetical protein|nr:DUF4143 domain-containing protein [Bifidobacteriaceae bacterium]